MGGNGRRILSEWNLFHLQDVEYGDGHQGNDWPAPPHRLHPASELLCLLARPSDAALDFVSLQTDLEFSSSVSIFWRGRALRFQTPQTLKVISVPESKCKHIGNLTSEKLLRRASLQTGGIVLFVDGDAFCWRKHKPFLYTNSIRVWFILKTASSSGVQY